MTRKHGPEATKTWTPLTGEGVHVFDQTNGLVQPPEEADEHTEGLSDEERSAAAAIISGGFSARM